MQDEHPIAALAEALDVSRSGGCAHRQKAAGVRRQEDQALTREIAPIFGASRRTYGCPRVAAALRQSGRRGGKNRVARPRRGNDLAPKQKRKRWRPATTDSNHRQPVAENWLAKVPAPDRPAQVGGADITSIDTGEEPPRLPVSSGVRANDQLQQKLTLNENYESLVHVFEERSPGWRGGSACQRHCTATKHRLF